ncbi:Gfo/Idh/MocA family protein [Bacillus massiliglaciei]|uniref:Gfo/Idh/MocA family protein n=1 Tax=Bacillus massiliglaciei TaxID=1816693 RepID=UPI000AFBF5E6|nr:Gfo/Idh/MocA family oxidoreductase [Bacillus massiliglaciei]
MRTLKVGVIGCGSIANNRHLPEYEFHKEAEIIAVADIVADRADAAARRYHAKAYTDYRELLKDPDIEAVSVCTPNYLHAEMTIAALDAGKHVLCEKPMAATVEDAKKMIEAAERNGKKLMIGHNQRFVPSHQKAKELIESGKAGKVYSFRTTFGHSGPETWSVDGKDSWFFKKDQAIIGSMGDLGVHKADLLRYLLGEEFTEVSAFIETSAKENATVDDNAVCLLRTASGIIGTLAASWSYVREDNATVIFAEKATLRLEDDPEYSLIVHHKDGKTETFKLGGIQTNETGGQFDSEVISHFVSSVLEDTVPPVSGEEGMKSLKVILGALESNAAGKNVRL